MNELAVEYDREGSRRREAGDADAAIDLFDLAIRQAPDWSVPWYNLGLTYKYQRQWQESYRCTADGSFPRSKDASHDFAGCGGAGVHHRRNPPASNA